MKLLNNSFALIFILLIALSFSGCDKDEGEIIDEALSDCDALENQMSTAERKFRVSCIVKYEDGSPAADVKVWIEIYKVYCEGETNGEHRDWGQTDENGYWETNTIKGYNYKNKKDVVELAIIVDDVHAESFIYPWHFVDDWDPNYYNYTDCSITIPNPSLKN